MAPISKGREEAPSRRYAARMDPAGAGDEEFTRPITEPPAPGKRGHYRCEKGERLSTAELAPRYPKSIALRNDKQTRCSENCKESSKYFN